MEMFQAIEAALNGLRMMPCPGCRARALSTPGGAQGAVTATCAQCDRRFDALAEVQVVADVSRIRGSCCAGYRRHDLRWRAADAEGDRLTQFDTWAQHHILLRPGDVATLLFDPGELSRPVRRLAVRAIPLMVGNHTLRRAWALVGSQPIATLR